MKVDANGYGDDGDGCVLHEVLDGGVVVLSLRVLHGDKPLHGGVEHRPPVLRDGVGVEPLAEELALECVPQRLPLALQLRLVRRGAAAG